LEGEQHLLLALELLQQIGLEIGAARDLEDLEQREQRHVMVVRILASDEMPRALEQILQPQQRPDALTQRVFVGDHALANCRYFWCRAATCLSNASRVPPLSITSSAAARRAARGACAARMARASRSLRPRSRTRATCCSSGQSTTSTRSTRRR